MFSTFSCFNCLNNEEVENGDINSSSGKSNSDGFISAASDDSIDFEKENENIKHFKWKSRVRVLEVKKDKWKKRTKKLREL